MQKVVKPHRGYPLKSENIFANNFVKLVKKMCKEYQTNKQKSTPFPDKFMIV